MIEADEKSTAAPSANLEVIATDLWLDSGLAVVSPKEKWLAVADIHYGYEVSRRAAGGLFPLWGMETIESRFAALLDRHQPETVIMAGDIVDGGLANQEAIAWLNSVRKRCERLVLVEGNHDRGPIRRSLDFVPSFETADGVFFHHGHQSPTVPDHCRIEATGHWHPSVSLADGAGLRLRLPTLVREKTPGKTHERWILPAFSPWAGGGPWRPDHPGAQISQWACGENRVIALGDHTFD